MAERKPKSGNTRTEMMEWKQRSRNGRAEKGGSESEECKQRCACGRAEMRAEMEEQIEKSRSRKL